MIRTLDLHRRALLRLLAGTAFAAVALPALAKSDDDANKAGNAKGGDGDKAGKGGDGDKAGKGGDGEKPGKGGAAKKSEGAVLTVVVTGNGKAIAQAEVLVKFPGGSGELKVPTGATGEATFKSASLGMAKVRVIAVGWESDLKQVELKAGAQRFVFNLVQSAGAAAPAEGKKAAAPKGAGNGKG